MTRYRSLFAKYKLLWIYSQSVQSINLLKQQQQMASCKRKIIRSIPIITLTIIFSGLWLDSWLFNNTETLPAKQDELIIAKMNSGSDETSAIPALVKGWIQSDIYFDPCQRRCNCMQFIRQLVRQSSVSPQSSKSVSQSVCHTHSVSKPGSQSFSQYGSQSVSQSVIKSASLPTLSVKIYVFSYKKRNCQPNFH